jgi:uncharacterized protein involved in exopolysaccharide biosynthesis
MPVDPRRILEVLRRNGRWVLGACLLALVAGVVLATSVLSKTYSASASLLWEPPATVRSDAQRELSTLVNSVKLPVNLEQVRRKLVYKETLTQLARRLEVTTGEGSMLITVTGKASSRQAAADLTNAVVDVFLESQKRVSEARLQETAKALKQGLEQSQRALGEARSRYDAFRRENRIDDLAAETQAAIEELARLRVAENNARVELEGALSQERAQPAGRAVDPAPPPQPVPPPSRPADARVAQLEGELAEARSRYTDSHPRVRALESEIASYRARAPAEPRPATAPAPSLASAGTTPPDARAPVARILDPGAGRRSIEHRRKALETVIRDAERRASKLTGVQGQAAQLLADVTVAQDHTTSLLKQSATAEDDVRGASSNFQVVSRAAPPELADKGLGRVLVVLAPLAALLATLGVVLGREIGSLRVRTALEASFWSRAPVLWSTPWPFGSEQEARQLGREVADVLEAREGVVGVTAFGDTAAPGELAQLLVDRIATRGGACGLIDLRERCLPHPDADLADALEHRSLGEQIARARDAFETVVLVLPSCEQISALRAALRWADALVVIVPSGAVGAPTLAGLRAALGLREGGLGLVVSCVPERLLHPAGRVTGSDKDVWAADAGGTGGAGSLRARSSRALTEPVHAPRALPPRS